MRLLTFAILLNLVLVPVIASIAWSMFHSLSRVTTSEFKLQRLVGTIEHYNEIMTMYAKMSAASGDPSWEAHYRRVEEKLDDALVQVALLARREYDRNYAAQTKLAYLQLIEMETLAFALVKHGRRKEAEALLGGERYAEQKTQYSQGLEKMTSAIQERISHEMDLFRTRMWEVGIFGVISLMILLAAWIAVGIALRRHLRRRKAAEEALEAEKERLTVTLRSIGEGVVAADTSGRIALMNSTAELLTGWSRDEAVGEPVERVYRIVHDRTRIPQPSPVSRVMDSGLPLELSNHTTLIARDGMERLIEETAAPIRDRSGTITGVVVVFRDMTEQLRLQEESLKAEKLESVGILAGGIAHDFNNILTAILGNVSLAKLAPGADTRMTSRLEEAEKGVRRAKDLTQQLLTFSKGGTPIKKIASLKELLVEWTRFALLGSNVKSEFEIDEDLWHVNIDVGQVSQVVNNLIINADQAMPEGGVLVVAARNRIVGGVESLPLKPGRYVEIRVEDEGVGIAPENLKKIFDPYFTTKNHGNGLGLATSYAAVRNHDGFITAESQVGIGTVFQIYLPACDAAGEERGIEVKSPVSGKGRVLLMDDDEVIRELARDVLPLLGYDVTLARDGEEALVLYRQSKSDGHPFDVVIMDLTVPGGMGGKEAMRRLLALDPSVKAIVSSGYSNDPIMGDYESYGFCGVLTKPYDAGEMSEVLNAALAHTHAGHKIRQEQA